MTPHTATSDPVVIVGAGLAGLVAARELTRTGFEVLVLEASDHPGGRITTRRTVDGFLIDRGYQVFLDAYPALSRHVDLRELGAARFDRGATIWDGRKLEALADPFTQPALALNALTTGLITVRDKLRLARLAARCARSPWRSAAQVANEMETDLTAAEWLRKEGFSDQFVRSFASPFWGGIALDRSLSFSTGPMLFTLRMFLVGHAALPREGMGAVPLALARTLPEGALRTGVTVRDLVVRDNKVWGVTSDQGDIAASAVVVATDAVTARNLTGIEAIPTDSVGCVTTYVSTTRDLRLGKRLLVNAVPDRFINEVVPLSNIQPSYAPAGQHLLSATTVEQRALTMTDEEIRTRTLAELDAMFGESTPFDVIAIERVPYGLFAQPPGIHRTLPDAITGVSGLVLAGDYTVDASQNGAILSGEAAARAVRATLPPRAAVA